MTTRGRKREGHRVGILSLTPRGEKFIELVFPKNAKVVKSLMRSLDGREQESLSRLCRKLRDRDVASLKLQAQLKRDHAWRAVAAQPDAEQASRRRSRVSKRAEPSLRSRLPRNASQHHAWKPEIRMIE